VGRWTVKGLAGVLLHEACHLLRRHADRADAMLGKDNQDAEQRDTWNIAADLAINGDLKEAGCELPGEGAFPKAFGWPEGLTSEEYYRMLLQGGGKQGKQGKERGKQVDKSAGDDDGDGDGDGDGAGQPGDRQGKQVGSGKCGGAAGNPSKIEQELDKQYGRTEGELNRIRRAVATDIKEYGAKGQGRIPAGLARWAHAEVEPPKVPWQQKLATLVRRGMADRAGAVDYRWNRPSRRQSALGYGTGIPVLPALRAPNPRVAVVIDTSGSMGDDEIKSALAETAGVVRAVGGVVTFIACDADVHAMRQVATWQQAAKLIKGGGGTDFRPALEALAKDRRNPVDICVYLTDGYGTAPDAEPPFRLIWTIIGGGHKPSEWGEMVQVEQ
jgi:predicted metal-dependent peptidase